MHHSKQCYCREHNHTTNKYQQNPANMIPFEPEKNSQSVAKTSKYCSELVSTLLAQGKSFSSKAFLEEIERLENEHNIIFDGRSKETASKVRTPIYPADVQQQSTSKSVRIGKIFIQ